MTPVTGQSAEKKSQFLSSSEEPRANHTEKKKKKQRRRRDTFLCPPAGPEILPGRARRPSHSNNAPTSDHTCSWLFVDSDASCGGARSRASFCRQAGLVQAQGVMDELVLLTCLDHPSSEQTEILISISLGQTKSSLISTLERPLPV